MATTNDECQTKRSTATRPTDLVDALNDPNRRLVLHAVHDASGTVDVAELVTRLVAFRHSSLPGDDAAPADIRTRLHHVHLPKLGAAGLVEYDEDAATVEEPATDDDVLGPVEAMDQLAESIDQFDGERDA